MLEQKYISGKTAVNIARSVESAVAAGKIAVGEQLPSVRELSRHLGVAGATIAAAYRILQERGVTLAFGRRGTRIRHPAPAAPRRARSRGRQSRSRAPPRSAPASAQVEGPAAALWRGAERSRSHR